MTLLTAAARGRRPIPRKLALLAATAVLLAVATCSPNGGRRSGVPVAGSSGSSSAAAFPVTIAHRFGSTTIEARPKRVVAVGLTEQDALLALGVVPIATTNLVDQSADYGNAVPFVSVLSLPYVLRRLVPQRSAAVDGDPGTKVPA